MSVTLSMITDAISAHGLSGRAVCLHSSLSSFGHVDGGAGMVVGAFMAEGCTLMVPAHWDGRRIGPLPHQRYDRNGTAPNYLQDTQSASLQTPEALDPTAIDPDMGAIPAAVVRWPGRCRGAHLALSFAALGPLAAELVGSQSLESPFAPIAGLIARHGILLMIGVGLTKLTALHFAEQMAGRELFRRWLINERQERVEFPAGGCSNGFERLAPALARHELTAQVGSSRWRFAEAGPLVESAAAAIRADPGITHCGNPACDRCRDAVLGGPTWPEVRSFDHFPRMT